jgi:hypothetical protein
MKELKRLVLHIVLLVVAVGFAWAQAQPDAEGPAAPKPGEVDVWGGSPADITSIRLENDRMVVVLEGKKDDRGQWFTGHVTPVDKHDEHEEPEPDAGAKKPHGHGHGTSKVTEARFVSVSVAEKLAEKLAPLRAKRAIGEVSGEREKAFGLHEPKATLEVSLSGKSHKLAVGGPTPGSGQRYVRDEATRQVYVIDASIVRDLEGGSSRLSERNLHGWKKHESEKAEVIAGEKSRSLVRSGTEGRRFWADAAAPDANDETAANWLAKVDRLRPVSYVEKLPEGAEKVVRIDYVGKSGKLGFIELHRAAGDGDKADYFVTSEQLRMQAKVAASLGEQVAEDLASLLP